MNMFSKGILTTSVLTLMSVTPAAFAQGSNPAAILDFDGDGYSDSGVFEVQDDGSPRQIVFTTRFTSSGFFDVVEGGKKVDLLSPGGYANNGKTGLAYARPQSSGEVRWITFDAEGRRRAVNFGTTEDSFVSGCDFNGNGMSDPAFVNATGLHVLDVEDSSSQIFPAPLTLGSTLVDLHCGDINGDGIDELALLEAKQNPAVGNKKARTIFTARVIDKQGTTLLSERRRRSFKIIMADFNSDGREELGSYRIKRATTKRIRVHDVQGIRKLSTPPFSQITASVVPGVQGEPVPGLQIMGRGNVFTFRFVDGGTTQIYGNLGSQYNLLREINSLVPGAEDIEVGGEGCSELQDGRDGAGGFLWKGSDHGGTLVVLFPVELQRPFSSVILRKNGRTVADLFYTGKANGNRQHWRNNAKPGSFPRDVIVTAQDGNKTRCWKIENPGVRND